METVRLVLLIAYVVLTAVTIIVMYRQRQGAYVGFKTATSALFVIMALICWQSSGSEAVKWLLPGLVFCFLGDIFLALAHEIDRNLKDPWFTVGVGSFLIAHLFLCYGLFKVDWMQIHIPVIFSALTVVIVFIHVKSPAFDFGKNALPSVIYSFFIGLLLGMGLNTAWIYGFSGGYLTVEIGSVLFFASDFMLMYRYFKKEIPKWLGAAVLIAYYAATMCFALFMLYAW